MTELVTILIEDETTILELPDGAKIEPLSPSREDAYCVIRGMIPPGLSVPLHSHQDAESFYVLSGEAEALVQTKDGLEWQVLRPGDVIHLPGGTKHAWRNPSSAPMMTLITCTAKLGRFLCEIGHLSSKGGARIPTQADIQRLVETSERYGYWLGSREENAAVGIDLG